MTTTRKQQLQQQQRRRRRRHDHRQPTNVFVIEGEENDDDDDDNNDNNEEISINDDEKCKEHNVDIIQNDMIMGKENNVITSTTVHRSTGTVTEIKENTLESLSIVTKTSEPSCLLSVSLPVVTDLPRMVTAPSQQQKSLTILDQQRQQQQQQKHGKKQRRHYQPTNVFVIHGEDDDDDGDNDANTDNDDKDNIDNIDNEKQQQKQLQHTSLQHCVYQPTNVFVIHGEDDVDTDCDEDIDDYSDADTEKKNIEEQQQYTKASRRHEYHPTNVFVIHGEEDSSGSGSDSDDNDAESDDTEQIPDLHTSLEHQYQTTNVRVIHGEAGEDEEADTVDSDQKCSFDIQTNAMKTIEQHTVDFHSPQTQQPKHVDGLVLELNDSTTAHSTTTLLVPVVDTLIETAKIETATTSKTDMMTTGSSLNQSIITKNKADIIICDAEFTKIQTDIVISDAELPVVASFAATTIEEQETRLYEPVLEIDTDIALTSLSDEKIKIESTAAATTMTNSTTPATVSAMQSSRTKATTLADINMKRSAELIDCQRKLDSLKEELKSIRKNHAEMQLLASLSSIRLSCCTWDSLPMRDMWKKQYVLAVLSSNTIPKSKKTTATTSAKSISYDVVDGGTLRQFPLLPILMRELNWERKVPYKLKNDKEIFLSRIATQHFRTHYTRTCTQITTMLVALMNDQSSTNRSRVLLDTKNDSSRSSGSNSKTSDSESRVVPICKQLQQQMRLPATFVIPKEMRNDPNVMRSVTYHLPELLLFLPSHHVPLSTGQVSTHVDAVKSKGKRYCIWDDTNVFLQWIRSPHLRGSTKLRRLAPLVVEKFHPCSIRKCDDLMLLAIRTLSWSCFDKINPSLFQNTRFIQKLFQKSPIQLSNPTILEWLGDDSTDINEWDRQSLMPSAVLERCGEKLRDSRNVVYGAVKRNGHALQYASDRLRGDSTVILEACTNDPTALVHAKANKGLTSLLQSTQFWLEVIFKKLQFECQVLNAGTTTDASIPQDGTEETKRNKSQNIGSTCTQHILHLDRLWTLVPVPLRQDRQLILAAIKAGCLSTDDIPNIVMNDDESFWIDLLQFDSSYWHKMPQKFQDDLSIVQHGITIFASDYLITTILSKFASLRNDRSIWDVIINSYESKTANCGSRMIENVESFDSSMILGCLFNTMLEAPAFIWQDLHLMTKACRHEAYLYKNIPYPVCEDRDIVQATLQCNPFAIKYLSADVRLLYPDLIADVIRSVPKDLLWDVFFYVPANLWCTNRDIATAWISNGGDYLHDEFPDWYSSDKEMFLNVAMYNPKDFCSASTELRSDKEYMKQIIAINGDLLSNASSTLQDDYDLVTTALASRRDFVNQYDVNNMKHFTFLSNLAIYIRQQLQDVSSFQNLFLCSISFGQQIDSDDRTFSCMLPLLDQGDETSTAYKKLIFEYIGLPTGHDLQRLRQASANLAVWGF